jgi:hypothetical protein
MTSIPQAIPTRPDAEHWAKFPHPSAQKQGNPITVRLPIETRPLYRAATALVGERQVCVWFMRPSILPPQQLEQLRAVIRQVRLVHHPHLAPMFGLARWHEPLVAWPHVRHTMAGLMATGRYRREDAAALVAPIAEALAVAHEERLVHGYLDPAQIAMHKSGPSVMGVGMWTCLDRRHVCARYVDEDAETIAPEVLADGKLSARADSYSVAMIFARLLSGNCGLDASAARRLFEHMGLDVMTAALAPTSDDRPSMSAIALELNRLDRQQFYLPAQPEQNQARAQTELVIPIPAPSPQARVPTATSVGGLSATQLGALGIALLVVLAAVAFYLASTL